MYGRLLLHSCESVNKISEKLEQLLGYNSVWIICELGLIVLSLFTGYYNTAGERIYIEKSSDRKESVEKIRLGLGLVMIQFISILVSKSYMNSNVVNNTRRINSVGARKKHRKIISAFLILLLLCFSKTSCVPLLSAVEHYQDYIGVFRSGQNQDSDSSPSEDNKNRTCSWSFSYFYKGRTAQNGGAIQLRNCRKATIVSCAFYKCFSRGRGGGLFASSDITRVQSCEFTACASKKEGGGLFLSSLTSESTITVQESIITGCIGFQGGGIDVNFKGSRALLYNLIVHGCDARDGGGMHLVTNTKEFSVYECILVNNGGNDTFRAGGIFWNDTSPKTLQKNNFVCYTIFIENKGQFGVDYNMHSEDDGITPISFQVYYIYKGKRVEVGFHAFDYFEEFNAHEDYSASLYLESTHQIAYRLANYTTYPKFNKVENQVIVPYYLIRFDAGAGTFGNHEKTATMNVKEGLHIRMIPEPKLEGYVFLYWRELYGEDIIDARDFIVDRDATFHAYYEKKVTVRFETFGGTTIPDAEVPLGGIVARPEKPWKKGYVFVNWYTEKKLYEVFNFSTNILEDITLYAGWGHRIDFTNEGELIERRLILEKRELGPLPIIKGGNNSLFCWMKGNAWKPDIAHNYDNFTRSTEFTSVTYPKTHHNDRIPKSVTSGVYTIVGETFQGSTGRNGGSAYNFIGASAKLIDVAFHCCSSRFQGGAVYFSKSFEDNYVISSHFYHCASGQSGGAIFCEDVVNLSIEKCWLSYCNASMHGGCLYYSGDTYQVRDLYVTESNFSCGHSRAASAIFAENIVSDKNARPSFLSYSTIFRCFSYNEPACVFTPYWTIQSITDCLFALNDCANNVPALYWKIDFPSAKYLNSDIGLKYSVFFRNFGRVWKDIDIICSDELTPRFFRGSKTICTNETGDLIAVSLYDAERIGTSRPFRAKTFHPRTNRVLSMLHEIEAINSTLSRNFEEECKLEELVVVLDPNGGVYLNKSDGFVTLARGQRLGPTKKPIKIYRIFDSWNSRRDGTGRKITADTRFYENTTIYAIWERPKLPYNALILLKEEHSSPYEGIFESVYLEENSNSDTETSTSSSSFVPSWGTMWTVIIIIILMLSILIFSCVILFYRVRSIEPIEVVIEDSDIGYMQEGKDIELKATIQTKDEKMEVKPKDDKPNELDITTDKLNLKEKVIHPYGLPMYDTDVYKRKVTNFLSIIA